MPDEQPQPAITITKRNSETGEVIETITVPLFPTEENP